jgi:hypothetical protein
MKIRDILYDLLITNVTASQIIRSIEKLLLSNNMIINVNKFKIIERATQYQDNLIRGRRQIIHLEGFIIDVMAVLYHH